MSFSLGADLTASRDLTGVENDRQRRRALTAAWTSPWPGVPRASPNPRLAQIVSFEHRGAVEPFAWTRLAEAGWRTVMSRRRTTMADDELPPVRLNPNHLPL